MTPGRLDLHAVALRLIAGEAQWTDAEVGALYDYIGALRTALRPFTRIDFGDIADYLPAGKWMGDAPTIGDVKRAAAVLASCTDDVT